MGLLKQNKRRKTMRPYYVGADPGKSGGLALLNVRGDVVSTTPMPEIDADLLAWLQIARSEARQAGHQCRAWVERVYSSPQMGVVSAFTFGQQNGRLLMALRAAGVRYELVTPGAWQKALGITPHAGDKTITKRLAQRIWPAEKVTHAIADALLLAQYGQMVTEGITLATFNKELYGQEAAPVRREEDAAADDDERQRQDPPAPAETGTTAGDRAGAGPEARRRLPWIE